MRLFNRPAAVLGTALAMALTSSAFAAEVEGPKVEWNVSFWGNPRAFTKGMETIAEMAAEKTGGNFQIRIAYGGSLSNERENLDGIKIGAFQMAAFCNFYHPGKNPSFMVFSLPFLPLGNLDVYQQVAEALYKHPALVADMDNWNAMAYMGSLLPQYEFLGRGEPPMTMEGWKGKRVRAGGGIGDAMEVLGATKMTVSATEVYTIMDRGAVDAASFPFTYAQVAYKIHEVSTWFTSNFQPGTSDCPTVINKDAWNSLPPQYQKLLMDLKPEGYKAMKKAYADIDAKNMPMLRSRLKEIVYPESELERFRAAAGKPVWDKWVADNKDKFDAQGVLDAVFAEAKKAGM